MNKTLLRNSISLECEKLIKRHRDYLFQLNEDIIRRNKCWGYEKYQKEILLPDYWKIKGFNPYIVKNKKNLDTYVYTINKKILDYSYVPNKSLIYKIPKSSGGERELNIFQIPDSAISRLIYKNLLQKNVNQFSSYAYAYREDRSAHDAILRISSDWKYRDRIYVAEFDFSKYFDNISHEYLQRILKSSGFLVTELEEYVISCFLKSTRSSIDEYETSNFECRDKGIPQGTSISLFLANIACWELDNELERIGVRFVRYADDTLLWCNRYDQIIEAYDAIDFFSKQMGVPINSKKSDGITIISEKKLEEMKTKSAVNYLGYSISLHKVSIKNETISNIKSKISLIIYQNLLQPINNGVFNEARITNFDWDYLVTIYQIRRYLYGGLNDLKLRRFRLGISPKLYFRGIMSYYPIVDDEEQLKRLDGWLIQSLKNALHKRERIWQSHNGRLLPGPSEQWINEIASIKKLKNESNNINYDIRIPSFLVINKTIRLGMQREGVESVTNPKSKYYPGSNQYRLKIR